jgi:hypothetical protein
MMVTVSATSDMADCQRTLHCILLLGELEIIYIRQSVSFAM